MRYSLLALTFYGALFGHAHAESTTPWSYDGEQNGQDIWGELSPEYAKCGNGTRQSPVIISHTERSALPALQFHYAESETKVAMSNLALTLTSSGMNALEMGGVRYALKSIEFHSPSEHMVRDQYYLLEIHLHHESMDGKKIALAVFVDKGSELKGLPAFTPNATQRFNPQMLLPVSLGYYAYPGSLTRPPCTEDIDWRVLKTPLVMSDAQMRAIITQIGRNGRLEQPIYHRTIQETEL